MIWAKFEIAHDFADWLVGSRNGTTAFLNHALLLVELAADGAMVLAEGLLTFLLSPGSYLDQF